ncbi:hypothetical protein [Alicyclobacillus dauci]|uniref:Uncharacterized protein n=1 Tax=Alicyclobacillus dauci TaxID=1475485 RepID=A0ABY6Z2U2_9BACL|nr:hypothetical protein [Alicyclobacillus dauci]WAH37212.1 hypothetical protein NZD86_01285 [Alicyclobacillus dauci]
MLGVILAHATMLLSFQVVLVLLGLTAIVKIVMKLLTHADFSEFAAYITQPVLHSVFPLIILSLLTAVDPTHFLVLIFYYLAALFIAIRSVLELASVLKSR